MAEERVKRRRLPSRHACIGCRRRKHRCDGERPECGGCRSRIVTCQYPSDTPNLPTVQGNGSSSGSALQELSRGSGIQHVATPLNTHQPQLEQLSSSLSNARRSADIDGLNLLWSASTGLSNTSGDTVPPVEALSYQVDTRSVIRSGVSPRLPNDASNASSPSDSGGPVGYFGDSSTFAFVSKVQPECQTEKGVHLQNKRHRELSISHSVQTPSGSTYPNPGDSDAIHRLPERHLADSLVDGYFDRVHPLYPFVHEGSFRAEYEQMWTYPPELTLRPSWYAILNLVFALGCEFCDAIPEGEVVTTVSPFVSRSREIIFSHIFKKGNLELVQALLLMCHYLQGTLELNECWNLVGLMIRTAVTIGLHLNPKELALTTVEREVRKRVWWGCFIIDRTLSMKFGRPPSIQAADVHEVPMPLSVDDQYIHNDSLTPRQPAARPSATAFFIHTIRLSKVIDNILRDLYTTTWSSSQDAGEDTVSPASSDASQILGRTVLLDGQLQAWWKEVPVHLRPDSGPAEGQIFQRQQTVMHVRYLQIRILLLRPLLPIFSRQRIDDDFLRAIVVAGSQTCVLAARQTVRMIYNQYHRRLLNSLWYNLHYIFTSMGVLLHVQMMDRSSLDMFGLEQEQETLECGMKFLTAASKTSDLAARYVRMLQGARVQTRRDDIQVNGAHKNNIPIAPSSTNNHQVSQGSLATTAQPLFSTRGERNSQGEHDLDGMNLNDLLFGTGLPQDVLSFEYPNGGFLL